MPPGMVGRSQVPMDSQAMMQMADILRKQGVPEEQIQAQINQMFGGDAEEMTAGTNQYEMSALPARAALTSDAKNAWGAAGNLVSGIYAGSEQKKYKELAAQREEARILRRRSAAGLAEARQRGAVPDDGLAHEDPNEPTFNEPYSIFEEDDERYR